MIAFNLSHNYTENTIIANKETTGQFYSNTQLTTLNSNNTNAVKYNFTHTVSIPNLGIAYITLK